ncbi:hypothetical protein HYY73_02010 [Candidatus Woesearchaeota archaeon]|nr:hypothetical protein [Candidatus Woesearchaeota archaeon]
MKYLAAIIAMLVLLSGCQTAPMETAKEPKEIMLQINDLPEGWTIDYEQITKGSDSYNNPTVSLEYGWQKGYRAVYKDPTESYDLMQFVDYYPLENVVKTFRGSIVPYDTQQELPDPKIGKISRAYKGIHSFLGTKYEIEFIKKNVHVLLTMDGENNYELLKNLARKVEKKI